MTMVTTSVSFRGPLDTVVCVSTRDSVHMTGSVGEDDAGGEETDE